MLRNEPIESSYYDGKGKDFMNMFSIKRITRIIQVLSIPVVIVACVSILGCARGSSLTDETSLEQFSAIPRVYMNRVQQVPRAFDIEFSGGGHRQSD